MIVNIWTKALISEGWYSWNPQSEKSDFFQPGKLKSRRKYDSRIYNYKPWVWLDEDRLIQDWAYQEQDQTRPT